jgi:hypothetical protein
MILPDPKIVSSASMSNLDVLSLANFDNNFSRINRTINNSSSNNNRKVIKSSSWSHLTFIDDEYLVSESITTNNKCLESSEAAFDQEWYHSALPIDHNDVTVSETSSDLVSDSVLSTTSSNPFIQEVIDCFDRSLACATAEAHQGSQRLGPITTMAVPVDGVASLNNSNVPVKAQVNVDKLTQTNPDVVLFSDNDHLITTENSNITALRLANQLAFSKNWFDDSHSL